MSDDKKKKGGGDEGGKEAQAPKFKPQLDEAEIAKKRAERAAKKAGKASPESQVQAPTGPVEKPGPARLRIAGACDPQQQKCQRGQSHSSSSVTYIRRPERSICMITSWPGLNSSILFFSAATVETGDPFTE